MFYITFFNKCINDKTIKIIVIYEMNLQDIQYFINWYENDKLISQETQYRFCVEKDTLLVAKFEKDGESANLENPANPENPDSGKDNNTGNNSGSGINENGGEKIESVSTGDESAVGFCSLMAVIMVSIVMCMAFTKIRRKKQRN